MPAYSGLDHGGRRSSGWCEAGGAMLLLYGTIARGTDGLLRTASQKPGADEHR